MTRIVFYLMVSALLATVARADQYWITYEGNDFPENEGWQRVSNGQPERWLEDGCLVIDSRGSVSWVEFYQLDMGGNLDPGPGEVFVMQWGTLIDEVVGYRDPGVSVFADTRWAVAFTFDEDTVMSVFEEDVSADFEPGVFHEFELRSADMLSYELRIDGEPAITGAFWLSLDASRVGWGDVVQGGASLVEWDYLRFGVVPEPSAGLLLGLAGLAGLTRRNQA